MQITIPVNPSMKNHNNKNYCEDILSRVMMVLEEVGNSSLPSVQFQAPPRIDEHTIDLDIDEDQQDYNDVQNGFVRQFPMNLEEEEIKRLYLDPLPVYPHSAVYSAAGTAGFRD